ncbi:MAG: hypothetical protein V4736_03100, partial [Bdellovibrionota bacterium]
MVVFTKRVSGQYCACGSQNLNGAKWIGACANSGVQYLTAERFADTRALPKSSLDGLTGSNCFRIAVPPKMRCWHGGLGPAMTGYGGGAQLLCEGEWMDSNRPVRDGLTRREVADSAPAGSNLRLPEYNPNLRLEAVGYSPFSTE